MSSYIVYCAPQEKGQADDDYEKRVIQPAFAQLKNQGCSEKTFNVRKNVFIAHLRKFFTVVDGFVIKKCSDCDAEFVPQPAEMSICNECLSANEEWEDGES